MQTKEETQPVLTLPDTFPVFAESDFAQRRPEVLTSYSHGSASLFNAAELQTISMKIC